MRFVTTAVAVMLLAGTARADMGAPWPTYRVPVCITISADPLPASTAVFVVTNDVRRLVADGLIELDSRDTAPGFRVYAVESWALEEFRGGPPPSGWFSQGHAAKYRLLGSDRVRGNLDFFDGRSEIVQAYRVERQGESVQLRKVADNAPRWWQSGSCCLCVLTVPFGLIWLGVRVARRTPT